MVVYPFPTLNHLPESLLLEGAVQLELVEGVLIFRASQWVQEAIRLFDPRHQEWSEHFVWASDGVSLVGLTTMARATIAILGMNRQRVLQIWAADQEVERHPPDGDLMLTDDFGE